MQVTQPNLRSSPCAARSRSLCHVSKQILRASPRCSATHNPSDLAHDPSLTRRDALVAAAACVGLLAAGPAAAGLASYDVTGAGIQEVTVSLSNTNNDMVFEPSVINLTAGRLTKLKLTNPSSATHYFTALELADKVYTVLVLAGDPAVEIKGKVQELALKPGASATWVLLPIKAGSYPLRCSVTGHTEAGMVGTVVVAPA